jgi:hypothetical protein
MPTKTNTLPVVAEVVLEVVEVVAEEEVVAVEVGVLVGHLRYK